MCGICGTLDWSGHHPADGDLLRRMLGRLRHRGPDEFGIYLDPANPSGTSTALGSARLSIIDLNTGQQPIGNEYGTLWIVLNGEIYNYVELRAELVELGHRFTTQTDTEVVLHLYEELGPGCLERLNGQFAIAIWNSLQGDLFLARDRVGIRPLFYAELPQGLVFASEIKAILLDPRVETRLDPYGLLETFTFWAPLAPRTAFEGISELPPGHYMQVSRERHQVARYWGLSFPESGSEILISEPDAVEQLRDLLSDATRLRLRADVTVGSYLSGGLDSTFIAALIREHTPDALSTFSIAFENEAFDERSYQEIATAFLGTDHVRTTCADDEVGDVLPQVVWHTEVPILRTSPAPMYLLSKLVRNQGIKVVLTGEGSDEFLGGYNIYKEDKVRRFWARDPESQLRPLLLRRLYPYIADLSRGGDAYLAAFFGRGLAEVDRPGYSHRLRWEGAKRLRRFLSPDVTGAVDGYDPDAAYLESLDGSIRHLSPLAQAQFLEISTFMSPYLLSSQGDRMMAANSVEGRFPFLDHRVIEFANQLSPSLKLKGLREKHILKESAAGSLPHEIVERHKQPYRAPIHQGLVGRSLDYVEALLSPEAIRAAGLFSEKPIATLVRRCRAGGRVGEFEDMALVGVLSTQLLHSQYIDEVGGYTEAPNFQGTARPTPAVPAGVGRAVPGDRLRVCHQKERVR